MVLEEVRTRLKSLDCDIIYSAGKFLDILPKGVNKGSTLQKLAQLQGWKREDILVAGDTLNDLSLFETGLKSVIPANAEPALLEKLGPSRQQIPTFALTLSFSRSPSNSVYFASAEGAAGVMEGIRHFELHPDQAKQKSNRFLIG